MNGARAVDGPPARIVISGFVPRVPARSGQWLGPTHRIRQTRDEWGTDEESEPPARHLFPSTSNLQSQVDLSRDTRLLEVLVSPS